MRKRKKKWTTKNTHFIRRNGEKEQPKSWMFTIGVWFAIIAAILHLLLVALNNHIVGYDNYIGIPIKWARSLFD